MPKVRIPTPLRSFTGNKDEVAIPGATVGEVLIALNREHPGIGARLLDDKGGLKRYVNVFLNDEDVRYLQSLDTKVAETDLISIIPAIAGG
ncbi:MAG TPA: ubiquitin-like small modifier protein 1 [Myxococcaceae bacterium]|nr:ubiquitin-like small modifier protein 1 [Myxococcaceae bacterium]